MHSRRRKHTSHTNTTARADDSEAEADAAGEADDDTDTDELDPDDPRRNDPAEMFARLRRKASGLSDDPDKPKNS